MTVAEFSRVRGAWCWLGVGAGGAPLATRREATAGMEPPTGSPGNHRHHASVQRQRRHQADSRCSRSPGIADRHERSVGSSTFPRASGRSQRVGCTRSRGRRRTLRPVPRIVPRHRVLTCVPAGRSALAVADRWTSGPTYVLFQEAIEHLAGSRCTPCASSTAYCKPGGCLAADDAQRLSNLRAQAESRLLVESELYNRLPPSELDAVWQSTRRPDSTSDICS